MSEPTTEMWQQIVRAATRAIEAAGDTGEPYPDCTPEGILSGLEWLREQIRARDAAGCEAEQLRAGIERVMRDSDDDNTCRWLQQLLDEVDASDALAYLEARTVALVAAEEQGRDAMASAMIDSLPALVREQQARALEWLADNPPALLMVPSTLRRMAEKIRSGEVTL